MLAGAGWLHVPEHRHLLLGLPIGIVIVAGVALNSSAVQAAGSLAAFAAAVASPPVGVIVFALMAPLKSPLVIPAPGFNAVLAGAILIGCVYRLPIERPVLRAGAPLLFMLGFVVYAGAQQSPEMLAGYSDAEGHYVGFLFYQLATLAVFAVGAAYALRGRNPIPYLAAGLIGAVFAAALAVVTFTAPATGLLGNLLGVSDANGRVVGPFADPNYFGLFEATAITAATALVLVVRSTTARLLLAGVILVIALSMIVSLSRGAMLAALVGLLGLAVSRSWRLGAFAVVAALVLVLFAYPWFVQWRVTADSGGVSAQAYTVLAQSDEGRIAAGLAGPQMFLTSPILGIGFGHYPFVSAHYVGYSIESHDWYMNVLAEQGLAGIVLWLSMLISTGVALWRSTRAARLVGISVLATYAVGSAFLQPPDSVQTSAFAVIAIAAALVGRWGPAIQRQPRVAAPRSSPRRLWTVG